MKTFENVLAFKIIPIPKKVTKTISSFDSTFNSNTIQLNDNTIYWIVNKTLNFYKFSI